MVILIQDTAETKEIEVGAFVLRALRPDRKKRNTPTGMGPDGFLLQSCLRECGTFATVDTNA